MDGDGAEWAAEKDSGEDESRGEDESSGGAIVVSDREAARWLTFYCGQATIEVA